MQNHMSFMDVVGNNIANVNTVGYKSSRVNFQDILGQTVKGASAAQNGRGGTNAAQIGLGMSLGGIQTLMTQGSLQSTGKSTDLAIQGDGFFVESDGTQTFYSRDGGFDIGTDGSLISPNTGLHVMGWAPDAAGMIDTQQPLTSLVIPYGARIAAKPSTNMTFSGNLDAGLATGDAINTTLTAYDTLGNPHSVALSLTKNATADTWDVAATYDDDGDPGTAPIAATIGTAQIVFDPVTGGLTTPADGLVNISLATGSAIASPPLAFDLDLSKVTQFSGSSQLALLSQDGSQSGSLVSFAIGASGEVSGVYSNGLNQKIGQIALAGFVNPAGLMRSGQNLWAASSNSGTANVGAPDTNGLGSISTGSLETSNVDLAQQFTNLIIAQRGFESSSKVISASDQMLQTLVNIIR